jgi:hypothetical protein
MQLLEKIRAYNKAVPFICNRDDYEGACYQFTSEYYNTMIKALALTDEEISQLSAFDEDYIVSPPLLVDYPIKISYKIISE